MKFKKGIEQIDAFLGFGSIKMNGMLRDFKALIYGKSKATKFRIIATRNQNPLYTRK